MLFSRQALFNVFSFLKKCNFYKIKKSALQKERTGFNTYVKKNDVPFSLTEMTKRAQNKPCDSLSEVPNRPTKDGGSNKGH